MLFRVNSLHLWRVWRSLARASVIREMEFRTNFYVGIVRQVLWLGVFVLFIDVLFSNTTSLAGWSYVDVLVILGLSRVVEGLMSMLFIPNWMGFSQVVNKGQFDFMLLRPLPAQFMAAFQRIHLDSLGNVLAGAVLLLVLIGRGDVVTTVPGVLLVIGLGVCGLAIYYSLLVLVASFAFVLERLGAMWAFNALFSEPLTVPFDVFPGGVRVALTYLLPIAFVVFVPAQALTGRLQWWQVPVGIGVAVVFLVLANVAWRAGLQRYSSASS